MNTPRLSLTWLVTLLALLCCGACLLTTQIGNARAATSTLAPSDTPTPPDCGDWRQWPNPDGTQLINPIYGVAALAPDDVWAVGFRGGYGTTNPHVLIQHWDGTQWTLMPADNPGILHAVAAVATDDVWAVGYFNDPAQTLTMHWDGSDWSIIPSPSDTGVSNNLYGVAASSSNDVWAVGNARNQSRVLHWDGAQWNIIPTPELEYSFLNAVAVAGPNDIWAVGTTGAYQYYTYILHWDGTSWTQVASPSPGSDSNSLQSISIVSPTDIWAAGWSSEGHSDFSPIILHWNGSQWATSSISESRNPQTTGSAQLFGITASSSTEAWAVGWGYDGTVRQNVLLAWDGTAWTTANVPNPSSYFNELFAVTSIASGEAWAVGYLGRDGSGYYDPQVLRYGPQCGSPTPTEPTATGTPPTATNTPTSTSTSTATNTPTSIPTVCGTLLSEGFEQGTLGHFTSVVATCVPGGCDWHSSTISPHTGAHDAFAPDLSDVSDQRLTLTAPIVPSGGSLLTFWHSYDLEGLNDIYFDGGVLEGSTNGGASWFDMGDNILSGGYVGTISPIFDNPLAGREAWGQSSGGYIQTVVNLSPYAGQSLLFRFREGTDSSLGANGWRIDDILVAGGSPCPTITGTPPTATSTAIPTDTPLVTNTAAPTDTATATSAVTSTEVPTSTEARTDTPLPTSTPTESLTPTPEQTVQACNVSFSDLQPDDTFYATALCLACNGMMSGYPDGTARLYNDVTRGQLAKLVSNAAGFNETLLPGTHTFQDIPPDSPFYIYIERVASRGIIAGYPCGGNAEPCGPDIKPYFRPNNNATRGQISKIVANAAQISDVPTSQIFEDVPSDNPFYLPIERLAMHYMMGGYQCGGRTEPCGSDNKPYFRPAANATRGQASKIVANTFFPDCPLPSSP